MGNSRQVYLKLPPLYTKTSLALFEKAQLAFDFAQTMGVRTGSRSAQNKTEEEEGNY